MQRPGSQAGSQVGSKDAKFVKLAEELMILIARHGIAGVTTSKLARAANVSRAWIYKYIGKDKADLMKFAVDHFGRMFAELDKPVQGSDPKSWIDAALDHVENLLKLAERYPWFTQLYYRFRGSENVIGERISEIERAYFTKQVKEMSSALGSDAPRGLLVAEILTAFRLGLAHAWTTGNLKKREAVRHLPDILRGWLEGGVSRIKK
jgi:AcrR family transcriptional regulator